MLGIGLYTLEECEATIRRLVETWRESPARFAVNFGADISDVSEKHIKAAGLRLFRRLKKGLRGQFSKRADDALMDEIFAAGLTRKPAKQYQFRIEAAKVKPTKDANKVLKEKKKSSLTKPKNWGGTIK